MREAFAYALVSGSVLVLSGHVWGADQPAQTPQGGSRPMMRCHERFTGLDANRDGMLTKDEFMAAKHPGGHAEEVFKSSDGNGDGQLTSEEFCSSKGRGQGRGQGRGRGPMP